MRRDSLVNANLTWVYSGEKRGRSSGRAAVSSQLRAAVGRQGESVGKFSWTKKRRPGTMDEEIYKVTTAVRKRLEEGFNPSQQLWKRGRVTRDTAAKT